MIRANQVSKSYANRRVLSKIDITLQKGEVVALVGMNGAGKTTLIRTLCGLTKPESGNVTIDGIPLCGSDTRLRQSIGAVLHASMLYNHLTCRENLEFYSRLYGLPSMHEHIADLLEMMGLQARAHDKVGTLSRGMQQRLSIARSLLHDPSFLLFDEVFSGLDQRFLFRVVELIKQQAAAGKGILFSTHDLEKVFLTATRVDVLHKGMIAFSGQVKEFTPQALYEKFNELTKASFIDQGMREAK